MDLLTPFCRVSSEQGCHSSLSQCPCGAESSGQRSNPGIPRHCWSFVPLPCMGIESAELEIRTASCHIKLLLSLLALSGWVLQALCQPYQEEPLHCLMGLFIPQAMDGKLCFRRCSQTGGDRFPGLQSSSGTEGEENCGGILAFQDGYNNSLFCAHYLSPVLGCQIFS